jgi:hypothetical protein
MARHRRRHYGAHHRRRRRFGDPVISMPSFGDAKEYNPFNKHVNSTDVIIGAGIGMAGGGLVNYGLMKFWPTRPAMIGTYAPAITPIVAGLVAYSFFRKKSKSRAEGYLAGAVAVGVAPTVWGMVKEALPVSVRQYFADPVIAMPSYSGFLTRSPGPMAGLLTASPGPAMAMSPARRAMGLR